MVDADLDLLSRERTAAGDAVGLSNSPEPG
jgi:hypothetical protein